MMNRIKLLWRVKRMKAYKACIKCVNTWEGKGENCPKCGEKYTHQGFTNNDNATKEDIDIFLQDAIKFGNSRRENIDSSSS